MGSTKKSETSFENKRDFLLTVLSSEEKRRDAVENKSSILIASNAVLISAMIGFVFPLTSQNNRFFVLQLVLTTIIFLSIMLSILLGALILTTPRRRNMLKMGLNPQEKNLFFFLRIAQYKKSDYLKEIDALTEKEILFQLTSQAHNLSKLLTPRYRYMSIAYSSQLLAIFAFLILSLTKLFS